MIYEKTKHTPTCAVHGTHDATTKVEQDGRWYHVCAEFDDPLATIVDGERIYRPSYNPLRIAVVPKPSVDKFLALAKAFDRPFTTADIQPLMGVSHARVGDLVRRLVASQAIRMVRNTRGRYGRAEYVYQGPER